MIRSILAASGLVVMTVLLTLVAHAHHSMAAVFDFNQRFTRTGTLTALDWRNPHIYLFVEATGDEPLVATWGFEGPAPTFFRRSDNVDKSDFEAAVGQTVTVDASRARDGSLTGLIRTITLPDGRLVTLCPNNC